MVTGMWIVIIFKHDFVEYVKVVIFNYGFLYWGMSQLINKSDTTVNIEYSLLVFYCQYYLPHAKFTTMV